MQFLLVLLIIPTIAAAEVWKYTDQHGAVHYVDAKEKIPADFLASSSSDLPAVSRGGTAQYEARERSIVQTKANNVEIFVTSWCKYCRALESYLSEQGVPFQKWDIEQSAEGKKKYRALGVQGVPVARIGKSLIRGFEKSEIDAALAGILHRGN